MKGNVVFFGGGNMAEGIIRALLKKNVVNAKNLSVSELQSQRCQYLTETYGVTAREDAAEDAKDADVVILAVLPKVVPVICQSLKGLLKKDAVVMSIAAGVEIKEMVEILGADVKVARVMPNTLGISGYGHSAVCLNRNIENQDQLLVEEILSSLGQIMYLPEDMFASFTAFSCSGPMWLYKMTEALIDAGVYAGFNRQQAKSIVLRNMQGVAGVLDATGAHPCEMVDEMTSPGGVTIEGLKVLQEEGGFGKAAMTSVMAAVEKARGKK